jgi:hypothetical protein
MGTVAEANAKAKDAASAATLTFHNGSIKAGVFQQGSGNAGRDINHRNVTNQSAGRDWVNRDQNLYKKARGQSAVDRDGSDDSE